MNIYSSIPQNLPKNSYVAIDTEIFGMNDKMLHRPTSGQFACMTIATSPEDVYITQNQAEIPVYLDAIKDCIWIMHSAKFDLTQLRRWADIKPRKRLWDTLLIERILWGGYFDTFGLADLSRRYLDEYLEKDTREEFKTATTMNEERIEYACRDAINTWRICEAQRKIMTKSDWRIWDEVDRDALWAVLDFKGMAIDVDKWMELAKNNKQCADELKAQLPFNPDSPKQVKEYLSAHGFKGMKDAQADTIEKLIKKYPNADAVPLAIAQQEYKMYAKRASTYGENFINDHLEHEGEIPIIFPDWNITGAESGRTSCVAKGTPIETPRDLIKYPDGTPIEMLHVGDWVYSFDYKKNLCLRRIKWIGITGYRKVLQITAQGEQGDIVKLVCTPDHLIRLFHGEWKHAGNLRVGNRLLCMVRRGYKERGYSYFFPSSKHRKNCESGGRKSEHRWIYAQLNGINILPARYDIHHKDGNVVNNSPDNLELVYHASHVKMHRHGLTKEEVESIMRGERENPVTRKHFQRLKKKYGLNGTNHTIIDIQELPEQEVWDMEVEDTHCFIANSIAVHNCSSPNLQNIPARDTKVFRECFVARPGNVLIVWDYSAQEPRICAELTHDKRLTEILHTDNDIYCEIAWDVHEKRIEKSDPLRDATKPIFLGLNYGMSEYGLAKDLGISVDEAEYLIKKFLRKYTGINEYIQNAKKEKKFVKTLLGRKAWLNPYSNQCERNAMNSPIQGSAGDMTKQAVSKMYKEWKFDFSFSIVGMVHDEIIADVPEKDADEVMEFGKRCAIEVGEAMCPSVPFKVSTYKGSNWACKE